MFFAMTLTWQLTGYLINRFEMDPLFLSTVDAFRFRQSIAS